MIEKIQSSELILVIFGASGDLTERKLIPALYDLKSQNLLPQKFAVLGVSRTEMTDDNFREKMKSAVHEFLEDKNDINEKVLGEFIPSLHYLSISTSDGDEYAKLKKRLEELDSQYQTN
jgi:glucose-6-phosphate 1-dehydrogenase